MIIVFIEKSSGHVTRNSCVMTLSGGVQNAAVAQATREMPDLVVQLKTQGNCNSLIYPVQRPSLHIPRVSVQMEKHDFAIRRDDVSPGNRLYPTIGMERFHQVNLLCRAILV